MNRKKFLLDFLEDVSTDNETISMDDLEQLKDILNSLEHTNNKKAKKQLNLNLKDYIKFISKITDDFKKPVIFEFKKEPPKNVLERVGQLFILLIKKVSIPHLSDNTIKKLKKLIESIIKQLKPYM